MNEGYEYDLSLCLSNFIGAVVKDTEDANGIEKKCICIPIEDNMISISNRGAVYACARIYRRGYETEKGSTHKIKTDLITWKAKRIMEMGYQVPVIGNLYRPWSLLNMYKQARGKK